MALSHRHGGRMAAGPLVVAPLPTAARVALLAPVGLMAKRRRITSALLGARDARGLGPGMGLGLVARTFPSIRVAAATFLTVRRCRRRAVERRVPGLAP